MSVLEEKTLILQDLQCQEEQLDRLAQVLNEVRAHMRLQPASALPSSELQSADTVQVHPVSLSFAAVALYWRPKWL